MKNFNLYLSFVLLLSVLSCKKKDEPVPDSEKFDLTNYFITGELPTTFSGGRTYNLPVAIFFDDNGQATVNWFSTGTPSVKSYKLEDDKIVLTANNEQWVFNLKDENITGTSGLNFEIKNVRLHKVPATNQFLGEYSGMLTSRHVNTAFPFKYVFNQTQFGEEMVDEPSLDYAINPIKNVFATTFIDNIARYFLIVDGKLTIVRIHVGGTNASTFLCATLSKDQ